MSLLSEQLADGRFVVTAEIAPPKGTNLGQTFDEARKLVGVTAVNITDNQGANMRLSSLALAARLQQSGIETILQLTCRDRNRMALQSDLLGAASFGIENLLLLSGDHSKFGDQPDARPVFDLDSVPKLSELRDAGDQRRLQLIGRRCRESIGVGNGVVHLEPDGGKDELVPGGDHGQGQSTDLIQRLPGFILAFDLADAIDNLAQVDDRDEELRILTLRIAQELLDARGGGFLALFDPPNTPTASSQASICRRVWLSRNSNHRSRSSG